MNFPHFNRRLHLYVSLSMLPWVLLYGISSIFFAHPETLRARYEGKPQWTPRTGPPLTLPTEVPIPEAGSPQPEMRRFARAVLDAARMSEIGTRAHFGAYRPNAQRIDVYIYTFLQSTSIHVDTSTRLLSIEDKNFRWDHFFTGMHARGGYDQDGFLQAAWAVVVDLVSLGFLLWVASGLYMWWTLGARTARNWGWAALAAGLASFALFMARL
jgi:hypothetical protein